MEKDLFETLDLVPQEVRNIIKKYEEAGADYKTCQNLIKELEQVGYTCEFGLDGVPYELKQLNKNFMKTTQEFDFVLDTKMVIWSRQKFSIEAATLEEAKELAKRLVQDGEEIDPYDVDFIYETEEIMTPEQNNGHATIVLMYKEKNNSIIHKNADK